MSADVSFLVSQAASTSSAMTSILQTSMQIAANASTSDRASTIAHTQTLLSSLVRCAVDNVNPAVLPPASAAEAALEVHKAFVKYVSSDSDALDALLVASALVDAMWLVDTELFDEEDEVSATVAASRARLVAFGRRIVNLKFVPEVLLKERLDFDFLESITVIPSAREANKKYIRLNTSILYKQQKFNLLREESEGFAMLETYLASNLPASLDVFWQSHHHGPSGELLSHAQVAELHRAHVHAKARAVLENITSLIGFFDLNPNKVVDVLLDVFVANVCDNWDFFVALLEVSHWQSKRSFKHVEGKLEPVEVKEPSPVLGQILGFKFDYYNSVASTHVTPPQLLWVTAILLKHKLVALEDVFPHLYPTTDEDMDAEYTAFRNKLAVARKEAGKYKDNALADAGALGGDGGDGGYQVKERGGSENTAAQPPAPGTSTTTIAPPATPTPKASKTNQKGVLASYLLAIGAISLARQIMDRHPTLIHMHPDIGDYMCRLLHVVIEPVYANLRPARGREHPTVPATQSPPMNTLNHKLAQQMERARVGRRGVLHYPKLSFFYEGWREGLPACTDYDAVVRVLRVLLSFVSVSLDVVLVSKLCRIGKAHLQTSKDEKVQNAWLSIISKFLFPALSMTDQNPALSNDVWSLVKTFPYDRRYALYGEWKHKTYTSIPALSVARAGCISDAKYTMRRLSKETVKRFGRYVGKIAHSNPVVAFHYILELLQMYENQNSCVVEGSKYMSEMSFDVVAFTLIEQLCDPKGRVQEGGIGVKLWLKSLSFFAGALFKKHAIELGGVVRFLYARLAQGQTVDLLLLQEIVAQMCGIKAITDDVTSDQFAALAGGETLRREAFGNDPVRVVKKSSQRLLRAVVETDLVMGFAVLMGQHVSSNVHADSVNLVTEIKVLGWQMDNIRATFTQYLDFIVTNMDREAFAAVVPSIEILRVEYGLTPDIAFAILRPKLNTLCQTRPALAPADAMDVDGEIENPRYHLALEDTVQGVTKTLHEIIWKTLSPHFYVSFWQLSLNDIAFPKARYQSEIAKLRATIESLLREKGSVGGNTPAKRKKDRERHTMTIQLLEKEMQVHSAAHEKTMERLKEESLHWFQPDDTIEDIRAYRFELVDLIIQHCLIPRCLFSPADAIFSAKWKRGIMVVSSVKC
ncbi:transcription factor/nuclear export subunit protein 2-domain-containing protein [Chytriomyces sp. MP71]|nr:transcription factor/nuclear export subunit protein 2-domain-containing protein [Chytriomyces sp. MP71]